MDTLAKTACVVIISLYVLAAIGRGSTIPIPNPVIKGMTTTCHIDVPKPKGPTDWIMCNKYMK